MRRVLLLLASVAGGLGAGVAVPIEPQETSATTRAALSGVAIVATPERTTHGLRTATALPAPPAARARRVPPPPKAATTVWERN